MNETLQKPFIVERDGEIDRELSVLPPTGLEAAAEQVRSGLQRLTGNISLQARMATFDAFHGTHYRRIRNELMEQQKRRQFERSIGLTPIEGK